MTTPFEQNTLPKFARWFANICDLERPDYIVPVERKGAHLLDLTLSYLASQRLSISGTVIYRRALNFLRPADLAGKRVVILDDTTFSGKTLRSYRDAVVSCGNSNVQLLACVGAPVVGPSTSSDLRSDIKCFLEPSKDLYYEFIWQLTEQIVARGLPPEVDHHVFSIPVSGSLAVFWNRLVEGLGRYGTLDHHEWQRDGRLAVGATLHWPRFFPETRISFWSGVRADGVIKVRLFSDPTHNRVLVLPMVFPKLIIPVGRNEGAFDVARCRGIFDQYMGTGKPSGDLILRSIDSHVNSPKSISELLYHAICLSFEIDFLAMLRDEVLRTNEFAGSLQFFPEEVSFSRLYGARVAPELMQLTADMLKPPASNVLGEDVSSGNVSAFFEVSTVAAVNDVALAEKINTEVIDATDALMVDLKLAYEDSNSGRNREDWETIGFAFSELLGRGIAEGAIGGQQLLLSRCIDFGCLITGLVPYVDASVNDEQYVVRRKYRTSESVILDNAE